MLNPHQNFDEDFFVVSLLKQQYYWRHFRIATNKKTASIGGYFTIY